MQARQARRARRIAIDALAYRAWAIAPGTAPIPPVRVLTDPRLWDRHEQRQLRRAQLGCFDTPAARETVRPASA